MPINLANVSISLQQFQAVSNGKYNAGDVKLTGEHTLGKVNNHAHSTGKNRVPLSQAEIVAVLSEYLFSKIGTTTGVGTVRWKKFKIEQLCVPTKNIDIPFFKKQLAAYLQNNDPAALKSINRRIYDISFIESR